MTPASAAAMSAADRVINALIMFINGGLIVDMTQSHRVIAGHFHVQLGDPMKNPRNDF